MRRLREKMRPAVHPPPWQSRRQFDDLAARFTAALTAAGGEVHSAADLSEALETLKTLLRNFNARYIVANDEPPLRAIGDLGLEIEAGGQGSGVGYNAGAEENPQSTIPQSLNLPISQSPASNLQSFGLSLRTKPLIPPEWHIVGKSPGDLRAFCATADVGLSSADAGLAESGTIVVSSGPGKSRLATLLPPIHIALLATDRLTADLFTWTAARRDQFPVPLPANVVLISGPSKSADIERTLAIGVHGPKRLIVLLYEPQNDES
jgi:L-lactate dehydrogenase complex protein LldG